MGKFTGMMITSWMALAGALVLAATPAAAQQGPDRAVRKDPNPPAAKPVKGDATPDILIYSQTSGFRHPSIPAANAALLDIARANGWTVVVTEDAEWFEADRLAQFEAVIGALNTGQNFSESQQAAFKAWLENGGAYIGLHAAGDGSHGWDWYLDEIIGARFTGHPGKPNQRQVTIHVEQPDHPVMAGMPEEWVRTDEWYSFDKSVRGKFNVLASLDEGTYEPPLQDDLKAKLAMPGGDHPIVWNRCIGQGRAIYSGFGHLPDHWEEELHLQMVTQAINWAMGEGDCP